MFFPPGTVLCQYRHLVLFAAPASAKVIVPAIVGVANRLVTARTHEDQSVHALTANRASVGRIQHSHLEPYCRTVSSHGRNPKPPTSTRQEWKQLAQSTSAGAQPGWSQTSVEFQPAAQNGGSHTAGARRSPCGQWPSKSPKKLHHERDEPTDQTNRRPPHSATRILYRCSSGMPISARVQSNQGERGPTLRMTCFSVIAEDPH